MKIPTAAFTKAICGLLDSGARSATVYVSDKARVTATRLFRADRRNSRDTIVVTYGALNYAGREFVKACKRAGEPLPVKKVQLRLWPKKRKTRK